MKSILLKAFWQMLGLVLIASAVGVAVNQIRPDGISLRASEGEALGVGFLEGGAIPLEEAHEGFQSKGSLFIDARSPELFSRGHIRGAKNLPWAEVIQNPGTISDLAKSTMIIVYDDGQDSSAMNLAVLLMSVGHKNTRVLDGGWSRWKKAGFPIETIN